MFFIFTEVTIWNTLGEYEGNVKQGSVQSPIQVIKKKSINTKKSAIWTWSKKINQKCSLFLSD